MRTTSNTWYDLITACNFCGMDVTMTNSNIQNLRTTFMGAFPIVGLIVFIEHSINGCHDGREIRKITWFWRGRRNSNKQWLCRQNVNRSSEKWSSNCPQDLKRSSVRQYITWLVYPTQNLLVAYPSPNFNCMCCLPWRQMATSVPIMWTTSWSFSPQSLVKTCCQLLMSTKRVANTNSSWRWKREEETSAMWVKATVLPMT